MTDDAYNEGYEAAFAGLPESKNPYPIESDEHLSWNDGYMAAEEEMDGES